MVILHSPKLCEFLRPTFSTGRWLCALSLAKQKNPGQKLTKLKRTRHTLIILLFYFLSLEAYGTSTTTIDNTVFVILRHARDENDDILWRRCYRSIRHFYAKIPIIIIDDNSKIDLPWSNLDNTIIIQSEHPGAGELLPYYYFLKYRWANKMIFLHDSMFLKRNFHNSELNQSINFHWHFHEHRDDNDSRICMLLSCLRNSDALIHYNHQKSLWNGCSGVASIIDINTLEKIERKYSFTNSLINIIKSREDRMALERVFAILMFIEGYVTKSNCSTFGNILEYPRCGEQVDNSFLEHLRLTYPGAILKTWRGR
jgi:hypothetical protein